MQARKPACQLHESATSAFSLGCTILGAQKLCQHRSHVAKRDEYMKQKVKHQKKRCAGAVWYAAECDMTGGADPAQPTYHHPSTTTHNNTQQHTTTHTTTHNDTQRHTTTTHNDTQRRHTTTTHNDDTQRRHTTTTHNDETRRQFTSWAQLFLPLCPHFSGPTPQGPPLFGPTPRSLTFQKFGLGQSTPKLQLVKVDCALPDRLHPYRSHPVSSHPREGGEKGEKKGRKKRKKEKKKETMWKSKMKNGWEKGEQRWEEWEKG